MILSFNIEYHTNWGEELRISGSIPELGGSDISKAIPLHTVDGIHWRVTIHLQAASADVLTYSYLIFRNGKAVRKEWNTLPRCIYPTGDKKKTYYMNDNWKNIPADQYFYSAAFTKALLAHPHREALPISYKSGLIIKASVPCINSDYCLAICGNQQTLGHWDADKALPMSDVNFPEWCTEMDASQLKFPIEYKFVLYNKKEKRVEAWESNPNRYLSDPGMKANNTLVISHTNISFDIPAWKGAGVAVPVFSLKSEKSFGIGDFGDLKRMIDWAVATNQKMVQILPINDTTMTHTWTDSYPYNSISIYASHPIYTDLRQLGTLKDKQAAAEFNQKQKELNALQAIDYEAVNQAKWNYFHLLFIQEGEKALASDAFKDFFVDNKEWLQPYAAFSYLRDMYQTPNFRDWPQYTTYSTSEIEALCHPNAANYRHIAIYYYVQFNLHVQLLAATTYARQNGVVLKGDIPIGISRNSVEAWTEPHYFNLDGQAGAPPDDFSVNGQNWGFPTYNWEVMEKDGYKWWMKRFEKMSEYFDAYRIDHILGFFRIWEIPMNAVHGLLGQFVPALPMNVNEIESYGLHFRKEFLTPYIHEHFLGKVFGPHINMVKETFIETTDVWEVYRMRPAFDTQRKIETYFAGKTDADSIGIREGLYALISNVLFVSDKKQIDTYHPRIGVQHDFIYQSLNDWEKADFNRLYDHYYYHRHNEYWHQQAMQKLPQLTQSTHMLVCGEDLGMIPDCVALVMNDLRILSLEIQRMPKNPAYEFGILNQYPYRSVCTISTHDMATLRGWWEEDYQQTQRYYSLLLGHHGAAPSVATPELCEQIVSNHLHSHSMLCVLALQDWLSIDGKYRNLKVQEERINVPANSHHYWRYRMHLTLEELMKAESLNEKIKNLITYTGRAPQK